MQNDDSSSSDEFVSLFKHLFPNQSDSANIRGTSDHGTVDYFAKGDSKLNASGGEVITENIITTGNMV